MSSRGAAQGTFQRADANGDAAVDISDALFILGFLFLGTDEPPCFDAADANDDGTVDISDATFALGFLFLGSEDPPSPGPHAPGPDPTGDALTCGSGPVLTTHGYVTSRMIFPTTQQQARDLGFDLDGEGVPENRFGQALAIAAGAGLSFQGGVDAALAGGRVVLLHQLEAGDLTGSSAGSWRVLVGEDVAPPVDLSGMGEFAVAPGAPPGGVVSGTIAAGRFMGGPGTLQVEIAAHPAVSFVLDLVGARIDAAVTEDGCSDARIGGGLTVEEVDSALIPGLADTFQAFIDEDPGSGQSQALLSIYDENNDGRIDVDDLRANGILTSLVAPDVDLLDEEGDFHPLTDGVLDSMSFGFGFECVSAQLSLPDGR